jgi:hypothetical protein
MFFVVRSLATTIIHRSPIVVDLSTIKMNYIIIDV